MTYSVVARDTKTGQLGVAVQTHWFAVGNSVPWLESGVGAIASQAMGNMDYGKKGLELLKSGLSPDEVIQKVATEDVGFENRQVALIDKFGNISAHTGKDCVKYAGFLLGDNFIVQGNILTNEDVLPAMKKAYEENLNKDFLTRLFLCIEAAQNAGGELRGAQSSAIRIVSGNLGEYDIADLRVNDHENPLEELRRQVNIHKAYAIIDEIGLLDDHKNLSEILQKYELAGELCPDNKEILFWKFLTLYRSGHIQEAEEIFTQFGDDSKWSELRKRIS